MYVILQIVVLLGEVEERAAGTRVRALKVAEASTSTLRPVLHRIILWLQPQSTPGINHSYFQRTRHILTCRFSPMSTSFYLEGKWRTQKRVLKSYVFLVVLIEHVLVEGQKLVVLVCLQGITYF